MKNALLASIAALSLACGVQASSSTPDTYEGYLKAVSQLNCETQQRCCGTTCSDANDANFYKNNSRQIDFINAGLLRYDASAAADCLAGTYARYMVCDKPLIQLPKIPASCGKVLVPNTQAGGMCDSTIGNCVAETVCTSGTCIALPAAGTACNLSTPRCVSTAYCDTVGGQICRTLPGNGQSCAMTGGQCATGFYCDGVTVLCTANGQTGQACSGTKPCDTTNGLVCLSNSTCGMPQPDGAPCTSPTHCQSARCSGTAAGSTCQPQLSPQTLRHQVCSLR